LYPAAGGGRNEAGVVEIPPWKENPAFVGAAFDGRTNISTAFATCYYSRE